MNLINYSLKIYFFISIIYPVTTWTMSNTEIILRTKLNMDSTYPITQVNTLQELLIRKKRQQTTDQSDLLQTVNILARLYSQEGDKLDAKCSPEHSRVVTYTALQLSALYGFTDIFKILLAYGANPNIKWKEVQFNSRDNTPKIYSYSLEKLIDERGNLCSIDSINSNAAQSMLAALFIRKWSLLWCYKSPEERAKLLGITLPANEPIS